VISASPPHTGPESAVASRVRDRLRREGIDPSHDPLTAEMLARTEVRRHNDLAPGRGVPLIADEDACVRGVIAQVAGFGPLQHYLDDPGIEEIWVNAPERVFVARRGVAERVAVSLTDAQVRDLVERMLQSTGRRVDLSQPFVDASLPDGSRVNVAIPDITRRHWAVNIRKFTPAYRDLQALVELGSLHAADAARLRAAVAAGSSILVSGPTHAGNTTCNE
jgi:pilus assembly protein CpaF